MRQNVQRFISIALASHVFQYCVISAVVIEVYSKKRSSSWTMDRTSMLEAIVLLHSISLVIMSTVALKVNRSRSYGIVKIIGNAMQEIPRAWITGVQVVVMRPFYRIVSPFHIFHPLQRVIQILTRAKPLGSTMKGDRSERSMRPNVRGGRCNS